MDVSIDALRQGGDHRRDASVELPVRSPSVCYWRGLLHEAVNQRGRDAGKTDRERTSHEVGREHRAAGQMPGHEERGPGKQNPEHDADDGAGTDVADQRALAALADEQQPGVDQEADDERGDGDRPRENHCEAVHEDADGEKGGSGSSDAQKEAYFLLHVYALSYLADFERNARMKPTTGEVIMLTIMPTLTASGVSQ
jgi:hypothetical protein